MKWYKGTIAVKMDNRYNITNADTETDRFTETAGGYEGYLGIKKPVRRRLNEKTIGTIEIVTK